MMRISNVCKLLGAALAVAVLAGCYSPPRRNLYPKEHSQPYDVLMLGAGDELGISFFGSPELDTVQRIRRDGHVTLQLIGDVKVAGMTPGKLQGLLKKLYAQQLQIKEVSVSVVSRAPVYTGNEVTIRSSAS